MAILTGDTRGGGKGLLREEPSSTETRSQKIQERVLVQSAYTQQGPPAPPELLPTAPGSPRGQRRQQGHQLRAGVLYKGGPPRRGGRGEERTPGGGASGG